MTGRSGMGETGAETSRWAEGGHNTCLRSQSSPSVSIFTNARRVRRIDAQQSTQTMGTLFTTGTHRKISESHPARFKKVGILSMDEW